MNEKIFLQNPLVAFSQVEDGNMSFKYASDKNIVKQNRQNFLQLLNVKPEACVALELVHGDKIVEVSKTMIGKGILDPKKSLRADGIVAKGKGVFLWMVVADCVPVVFYDTEKKVVALVHAGWPSTQKKLPAKMTELLFEKYGVRSQSLQVVLGPYISKESYTFEDGFEGNKKKWGKFLEVDDKGILHVDVGGFVKKQCLQGGVLPENILDLSIDTLKDEKYPSHRRSQMLGLPEERFGVVAGFPRKQS
jgi:YfiH family protein